MITIVTASTECPTSNGMHSAVYQDDYIQNGGPKGIALVAPNGTVMEFLSYQWIECSMPQLVLKRLDKPPWMLVFTKRALTIASTT
jgi:hypothetical protein